MSKIILSLLLLLSLTLLVVGEIINIDNQNDRKDTDGNIMDIHDGDVLFIDGIYYWYGASYGDCTEPAGDSGCASASFGSCGFRSDHNVSLYTSADLQNWKFEGHVFSATQYPQQAILFCPKVIYNAATKLYVLWTNWVAGVSFSESYYASAVSSSPLGPFKLAVNQINTGFNNTGDFSLFVDDNGDAYVIYTAHITGSGETHRMSVEMLTSDYLQSQGLPHNSGFFGNSFVEAPVLFKSNNGLYYALFGQCCCYCQGGSPVYVHTATNPLGPYNTSANAITSAIPAQQTNVFSYYESPGKLAFMWQGDRWQSAPDHIKGHDLVYFGPLVFDGNDITPLPFNNTITVNVYVQN